MHPAIDPLKTTLLLCIVLLVGGCATPGKSTGVIQVSPDKYVVNVMGYLGVDLNTVKKEAFEEATKFAEANNMVMIPLNVNLHQATFGENASCELQFRVVSKSDPEALTKAETNKAPDVYTELMKFDDLRKKGLITDAEYETEKKKLLSGAK